MKTKSLVRALALICILALSISMLVGCDGIDPESFDGEMRLAYSHAKIFLDTLSGGYYDAAQNQLHPHFATRPAVIVDRTFHELGINLKAGITDRTIIGTEYSFYSSDYDGSRFEFTILCVIGDREAKIILTVVDNDAGYGVYELTIGRA